MSVVFNVKEHLTVSNTTNNASIIAVMHKQLEQLIAHMSNKRVNRCILNLTADGKDYTFCGTEVTPELTALLVAMTNSASVVLSTSYEYEESSSPDCTCAPISSNMCQQLSHMGQSLPEGLFYCAYSIADCDNHMGSLAAYGTRNGKHYFGEVPYAAAELPNDGAWFTPQTAVVYQTDCTENLNLDQIKSVCEQLCTLSQADTLAVSEHELCFFLNNLQLTTKEQMETFIRLYAQLMVLTDSQCSFVGELVDLSGETPRFMQLNIQANGEYTVQIAAI